MPFRRSAVPPFRRSAQSWCIHATGVTILAMLLLVDARSIAAWCSNGLTPLPNGEYRYRVNTQSLVAQFEGSSLDSLSESDWEWWIAAALSVWVTQARLDVEIVYLGRTTASCLTSDGSRVVGAHFNPTAALGSMSSGSDRDICVNSYHPFSLALPIPGGVHDLFGTLVHEFGHLFGLGHPLTLTCETDGTVMAGEGEIGTGPGFAYRRFLSGDDIAGVTATYGVRSSSSERYRSFDPAPLILGSGWLKAGSIRRSVGGAVGVHNGTTRVVCAAVNSAQTHVWWDWTDYPAAGPGATWSNNNRTQNGRYTPAVASNTNGGSTDSTWVTAIPRAMYNLQDCPGVDLWRSTNLFSSITPGHADDICTNAPVALAYSPQASRWVMAYVGSFVGTPTRWSDIGKLIVRTSTDGLTFPLSSERELPYYSNDAPSLACSLNDCLLGFANAGANKPSPAMLTLGITSAGDVSWTTAVIEGQNFTTRTPQVVYLGVNDVAPYSDREAAQLMWWSGSYTEIANGRGRAWLSGTSGGNVSYTAWNAASPTAEVMPGAAATYTRSFGFFFWGE